jgi:adenine-specific DNA-methyltransferase
MLSETTKEYYKNTSLEHRKNYGQYMTPYDIIQEALKMIDITKINSILEPSCGTGQFIEKILEKNKKANIDGIELDKNIYDTIKTKFNKKVNLINTDFLLHDFKEKKYKLIIGNPPYFEIDKKNNTYDNIIQKYDDVLTGRINIYTLFIRKAIDLLEDDGILLYVIPTSLLTSKYFENIRNYIIKKCNLLNIKVLNSDNFEDALQQTMIFIVQKTNINDGKFIIKLGNTSIFNEQYIKYNNEIKNKKYIIDLDCTVKTGSVVWNQCKDFLTNDKTSIIKDNISKNNIVLIYPRNLNSKENKISLSTHEKKKQYLDSSKYKKPLTKSPVIAINRIIGVKDITLNPILIETGEYCFENHINIISGELTNLKKIYESLKKPETINFIKNIIGNTQLSKTELETMIPLF